MRDTVATLGLRDHSISNYGGIYSTRLPGERKSADLDR